MNEMNLSVNAIEPIYGSDLKVYGVERGKKQGGDYSQAAKAAVMRRAAREEVSYEPEDQASFEQMGKKRAHPGENPGKAVWIQNESIEKRQEQIEFQKMRANGTGRIQKAIASYEENFLIF